MTVLSAEQAIQRFKENEARVNEFVNTMNSYLTNSNPSQLVESLPAFMQRMVQQYLAFRIRGAWQTSQSYLMQDIVTQGGYVYICLADHTSGTFNTDLTANKWALYQGVSIDTLASSSGAGMIGYGQRNLDAKLDDDLVSPADFPGFYTNGTSDSSAAFAAAIATGKRLTIPAGTFKINVTVPDNAIWYGQGSNETFIYPYDTSVAAITYTKTAPYWTYHSEFHGIGFYGSGKVGVGFTFAKTNPADYATYDEYANNVRFIGCTFRDLDKAVQCPFGNIGVEFYSCGIQGNRYGLYSLSNKFGGTMHAGNKYFFGGEISSNDCAIYIHNTTDGFGGLHFDGTIFEYNKINGYIYTTNVFCPPEIIGTWSESSGVGTGASTVTIDAWSGTTKTTQTLDCHAWILDGTESTYNWRGGFFTDVYLKATHSRVLAYGCRVETNAGVGGQKFIVDSDDSQIRIIDPHCDLGMQYQKNVFVEGNVHLRRNVIGNGATDAVQRHWGTAHPTNKTESAALSGKSFQFTTQTNTGSGSFNLSGTVVSDGVLFPTCNEYTAPFTASNQFTRVTGSEITTSAGWYVFTLTAKVVSGTPRFYVWDRNQAQFSIAMAAPTTGKWHTFAAYGYSAGSQTLYLDIGGTDSAAIFRLGGFQIWRFDTEAEAVNFLKSGSFCSPVVFQSGTYDPPSLANGSGATTTLSATGAAVGDHVRVSFSQPLQGVMLNAWVSAADTISVRFHNQTGATVDLASGTIYATCIKP